MNDLNQLELPRDKQTPKMLHCDFCGLLFDPSCQESSCNSCPLARNCTHYTCPRCGYPVLPEARLFTWARQVRQKIQRRRA